MINVESLVISEFVSHVLFLVNFLSTVSAYKVFTIFFSAQAIRPPADNAETIQSLALR